MSVCLWGGGRWAAIFLLALTISVGLTLTQHQKRTPADRQKPGWVEELTPGYESTISRGQKNRPRKKNTNSWERRFPGTFRTKMFPWFCLFSLSFQWEEGQKFPGTFFLILGGFSPSEYPLNLKGEDSPPKSRGGRFLRRLFVTCDVFTRYFFVVFPWLFRGFSWPSAAWKTVFGPFSRPGKVFWLSKRYRTRGFGRSTP